MGILDLKEGILDIRNDLLLAITQEYQLDGVRYLGENGRVCRCLNCMILLFCYTIVCLLVQINCTSSLQFRKSRNILLESSQHQISLRYQVDTQMPFGVRTFNQYIGSATINRVLESIAIWEFAENVRLRHT